jgi:hypothetical protein
VIYSAGTVANIQGNKSKGNPLPDPLHMRMSLARTHKRESHQYRDCLKPWDTAALSATTSEAPLNPPHATLEIPQRVRLPL